MKNESTLLLNQHLLFLVGQKELRQTIFFFFFFVFLGPYLRHMEVSRLGVELELQQPAYTTATATYTAAHSNARSLTH